LRGGGFAVVDEHGGGRILVVDRHEWEVFSGRRIERFIVEGSGADFSSLSFLGRGVDEDEVGVGVLVVVGEGIVLRGKEERKSLSVSGRWARRRKTAYRSHGSVLGSFDDGSLHAGSRNDLREGSEVSVSLNSSHTYYQ